MVSTQSIDVETSGDGDIIDITRPVSQAVAASGLLYPSPSPRATFS